MDLIHYVFDFLWGIVRVLDSVNVPGFSFTFWEFSIGTFAFASGVAILRTVLGGKERGKIEHTN